MLIVVRHECVRNRCGRSARVYWLKSSERNKLRVVCVCVVYKVNERERERVVYLVDCDSSAPFFYLGKWGYS